MALVHALAKMPIELIAIYFHSFEICIIQIGEMAFCKPVYYYQVKIFSECLKRRMLFFGDFEALVRERRFRVLLCSRVILQVVSSKNIFMCYQTRIIKKH
jgi:hypothetical protein